MKMAREKAVGFFSSAVTGNCCFEERSSIGVGILVQTFDRKESLFRSISFLNVISIASLFALSTKRSTKVTK